MAERSDESVSRRALLRRGVIVGGLAWTAPLVVQSIAVPAGAQVSPGLPSDADPDDDDDESDRTNTTSPLPGAAVEPASPLLSDANFTG